MEPLTQLAINTIRLLSVDAVQKANAGHPGLPMGAAPMTYVLWQTYLSHNPENPKWPDRDRFVLSGGHGSMLLYSMLHLTGYDLALDELRPFASGARARRATRNLLDRRASRRPRVRLARARQRRRHGHGRSDSSRAVTTGPARRSLTTSPTPWWATAT